MTPNRINKRKRLESEQICETEETLSYFEDSIDDDDQLLMSRESHSCVYEGFEKHFQKLFDSGANILFQCWTIHTSFGNELSNAESMEQFVKEILSFREIDKIKQDQNTFKRSAGQERTLQRLKTFMHTRGELKQKIGETQKFGSFVIPKEGIERQIFQTAMDVIR